ncbi:unnamed protein product, partial [Ranitomeya imitator]
LSRSNTNRHSYKQFLVAFNRDPLGLTADNLPFTGGDYLDTRHHNEFHEQCVERIFNDLTTLLQTYSPECVCRYTRRGGLDINRGALIPTFIPLLVDSLGNSAKYIEPLQPRFLFTIVRSTR